MINLIINEKLGTTLALGDVLGGANSNKRLDTIWRKNYGRVLTAAAWVGDAGAAADGALELFDDLSSIYKMWNVAADSILQRTDLVGLEGYIASKHKFQIECIDAMSNNGNIMLSFLEQRAGESLVGKIQGAEVTLFENLGTMTLNQGLGMEATKELGYHMVDEDNDRFVSFVCLQGGSAVVDSQIAFTVDGDFRGSLWNHATTKVIGHNSWFPANIYIPRGATFDISCIDAFPADCYVGLKILKLTDSGMAAAVESAKPDEV